MHLRRLRLGEWLAAAGGVLLVVTLAMPWWYFPLTGGDPYQRAGALTGFESYDVLDVVLVLVALVAIALAVLQATRASPAMPVGAGVLTVVFGALGALLLAYRLVNEPGPDWLTDTRAGPWLGLAATIAITVGGWESIRKERVRDLPPGPEPEVRSAP